jgi:uncharacterized protein YceK
MFKRWSRKLFSSLVACSLVGCGTVQNLRMAEADRPVPYGGVSADLRNCEKSFDPPNLPHGWFPGEMIFAGAFQVAHAGLCLADVPFSAVGDTLTLPWTTAKPASNALAHEPAPSSLR